MYYVDVCTMDLTTKNGYTRVRLANRLYRDRDTAIRDAYAAKEKNPRSIWIEVYDLSDEKQPILEI